MSDYFYMKKKIAWHTIHFWLRVFRIQYVENQISIFFWKRDAENDKSFLLRLIPDCVVHTQDANGTGRCLKMDRCFFLHQISENKKIYIYIELLMLLKFSLYPNCEKWTHLIKCEPTFLVLDRYGMRAYTNILELL